MKSKNHTHNFGQALVLSLFIIVFGATQAHSLTLFEQYLDDFKTAFIQLFISDNNNQRLSPKDLEGKPLPFAKIINKVANENQLSPLLLHAIIWHESSYNNKAVSSSGAAGLMQLMPATAEELQVTNCFDPSQNIAAGARYYRKLYNKFGSHYTTLVAYNSGPGTVLRGKIYKESDKYAKNVLSTWRQLDQSLNRRNKK